MKSVSTNILEGIKKRKLVEGEKVDYYGLDDYINDNFEMWSQGMFSDCQIAEYIFKEGFDEDRDDKEDIDTDLFDKVYDEVSTFFSKKEAELTKYIKEVLKKYNYCRAKGDSKGGLKESSGEPLVLDTELADKTFYDMRRVQAHYPDGRPDPNELEHYYIEVKGYAGRTYTWDVGYNSSGKPYLFMDYMPSKGELSIRDNLFHDYFFRGDDKSAIIAKYLLDNKEKFMKQDKTKKKPKNIKEAKETKKQFEVFIEEVVSEAFNVEAVDMDEAAEIMMNKYNKGEVVLEPGNLVTKSIMVRDPDTEEETGWNEF